MSEKIAIKIDDSRTPFAQRQVQRCELSIIHNTANGHQEYHFVRCCFLCQSHSNAILIQKFSLRIAHHRQSTIETTSTYVGWDGGKVIHWILFPALFFSLLLLDGISYQLKRKCLSPCVCVCLTAKFELFLWESFIAYKVEYFMCFSENRGKYHMIWMGIIAFVCIYILFIWPVILAESC